MHLIWSFGFFFFLQSPVRIFYSQEPGPYAALKKLGGGGGGGKGRGWNFAEGVRILRKS